MRTKAHIVIFSLFICSSGFAQLSIEACHEKAKANYPLINQYDLIEKSKQYSLENIAKNYLPQIALNGQATYQSDVTKIPVDFASLGLPIEIPEMSKDQYKAAIDVSQIIWDGGITNSQKEITKAASEIEKKRVDVSLYAIEEKVTQLFFGILAIDARLKVLDLKEADMIANQETVESMFKNGMAMQTSLDQIHVEILNVEQSRTELLWMKNAYSKMLSLFIHEDISENTVLQKPDDNYARSNDIARPELSLFDSQIALYNAQNSAITAKNMPRLSLFVQGGYGRPGLNMLEDEFKFFGIGGIRLTWNFGNLYTKNNEKRLLGINKSNVEVQRATFLFNTDLQSSQELAEIEKYRSLLAKDDEIIALRNRVKRASESMFRNGVYQTNELIRDINAEEQARQSKAIHEIQYLLNIHNYTHTRGK